MEDMVSKVCSSCGKKGPDLLKFSVCKSVWYCNVQCQKKDWKSHKQCCGKSGEAENGQDTGEGQSSSLTLSTTEDLVSKVCSSCGKKGPDLLKCSACKSVWYCNVQCQKKDWKSHKQCCGKSGEAENGQDTGEGQSSSLTLSTTEDLVSKVCSSCGKKGLDSLKCSVCKSVWYCNVQCQKKDWKSHKHCCGKSGEAENGQDTGEGLSSSLTLSTTEDLFSKVCSCCGKKGLDSLKCSVCKSVWYCNVQCQKKDWKSHKQCCGKSGEAENGQDTGEGLSSSLTLSTTEDLVSKVCSCCGKKGLDSLKCSVCKSVWYCNVQCQKKDWKSHKQCCGKSGEAENGQDTGEGQSSSLTLSTTEDLVSKVCSSCGKKGSDLIKCSVCKSVWYCNVQCQKKDWKSHKQCCGKSGEAENGQDTGEGQSSSLTLSTTEDLVSKVCSSCGKKGPDLLKCSVCKSVWYCNVQCQKKDWKSHKQCCGKSREAENGQDTGEGQISSLTLSTTEDLVSKVCSCCGKKGLDSLKCSVCKSVWYCNVQCQKKDWKSHKQCCGKSGEAENGQDTGEGLSSSLTLSTTEDLFSKVCSCCGKKGLDSLKCSVCKSVWYCNVQCQKKDWKSHKQCCGKSGEAENGQDTGEGLSSSLTLSTTEDLVSKVCSSCGKKGPDLLKCSVCKSVWYCNVQCQKKDWKSHKQCCGKSGEAENGQDTGEGQISSLTLSTTEDLVSKVCSCCGKKGLDSLKCSVCKSVWYCNVQCQKKDWKSHKQCCGKSGEAENGQDTGEGLSSSLTLSTTEDLVSKVCSCCGKKGLDSLKCSVCKSVWYCNVQCQKKDWKSHKQCCGKSGEAENGQDTGEGLSSSLTLSTTEDLVSKVCSCCGKKGLNSLKCSVCKSVWYCNVQCQKKDWKSHKQCCGKSGEVQRVRIRGKDKVQV